MPLGRSVSLSLYDWDGLGDKVWAGAANYREVFTDPELRGAFGHALVLIVFYAIIPVVLGTTIAATMMRARRMRGLGAFRVLIFLPQVVPMVVVAIAWRQIYQPDGPLNSLLRLVGLDRFARPWLGDYTWALPSVGLVGTWVSTGLCFVLALAGMAKIPRELYEAARLDGAGPVREFFAITLPAIRGEVAVALTLTVIAALKTFDLVYVMTSGGPGTETTVPSYQVFRYAFQIGQVGTAAASGTGAHRHRLRRHRGDQPHRRRSGPAVISRSERLLSYGILVLFAAVALYPVALILARRCSPTRSATPVGCTSSNFAAAWEEGHFSSYMRTSVVVAVLVVGLATTLSVLAGYAFGTMRFPGSEVIFYVMLLGIMVPAEALVVPLYFDLRSLGYTDTLVAIVMPQVAQSTAFGTFWMRAYFRTSSREVVEAARLDGAGHWRTLWSVLVPMGRPAITTMVVLVFMWTWNEFLIPLVMATSEELRTAPLGLAFFQGRYTSGTALLAAGATLVALPVVVVYLFLQRHFIRGMVEGAVK